jgi:hypothetical protein
MALLEQLRLSELLPLLVFWLLETSGMLLKQTTQRKMATLLTEKLAV